MSDRIAEIRSSAIELQEQESSAEERVQIRVDSKSVLPIYLGRSFPRGDFSAVIRSVSSSDLPAGYRKPDIQGLAIEWQSESPGAGGSFDFIMELIDIQAIDVFVVFIARLCEVAETRSNPKDAVRAVIDQIELWRTFFSGAKSGALSDNKQTGLYGELSILDWLIEHGMSVAVAVEAWTGSSATNQDFELGPAAIEVKSTTSADTNDVPITNIRQLDTTGLDNLFLARPAFDVRQGGERTLVSLVSSLRETVATNAAHLQAVFGQKLLSAKYHDEHANEYENRAYTLRELRFYRVEDQFPHLIEEDIQDGVSKVKYNISLHGCSKFIESPENVLAQVNKSGD